MATATVNITKLNETLSPFSLSGSADQITITASKVHFRKCTVTMRCDTAWIYRSDAGGNNYSIPANEKFTIHVLNDSFTFEVEGTSAKLIQFFVSRVP